MATDSTHDTDLEASCPPLRRAAPWLDVQKVDNGWLLEGTDGGCVVEEAAEQARTAVNLLSAVAEHLGLHCSRDGLHFRIVLLDGEEREVE